MELNTLTKMTSQDLPTSVLSPEIRFMRLPWCLVLLILGPTAAIGFGSETTTAIDKVMVAAILKGNAPTAGCDARLVAAVRRIHEVRGQLEFDDAGRVVGIDLASGRISVGDADVKHLAPFGHLVRLRLAGEITAGSVAEIARHTTLMELALINPQIDNAGLAQLAALEKLQTLLLQRAPGVTDEGLAVLAHFPRLTALSLIELNLTDAALERLASIRPQPPLKLLDLRGCSQLTDAGLKHLTRFPRLKALRLRGSTVTDATMAILREIPKPGLASLTLEDCGVTNQGLAQLDVLPIDDLVLFRCFQINDEGLQRLAKKNLRQLSLRDMMVTDAGLAMLRNQNSLRSLRLNELTVSDDFLPHLAGMKHLTRLELRRTRITDAGLKTIGALPGLSYLDLEEDAIGDAGIVSLGRLTKLEYLNLRSDRNVTDLSVEPLARLRGLKTLPISLTGISEDGARRLQAALPQCKVIYVAEQ